VLLLGLVLLSALLLLGLVTLSNMLFQQRIAGNSHQQLAARQASGVGMRWAGAWLASRNDGSREDVDSFSNIPPNAEDLDAGWWKLNSVVAGINPVSGLMVEEPMAKSGMESSWLLEEVHSEPAVLTPGVDISFYRILSIGKIAGQANQHTALAITESIIARPWGAEYESGPFPPVNNADNPIAAFCSQFDSELPCGQVAWRQRK
jgi:hypothetical protein